MRPRRSEPPVLVTGVSGFAGSQIAAALAQRVPVVGTVHTGEPDPRLQAVVERVDLGDPGATRRLVDTHRPRAVVHAAAWANPDRCERDPEGARRANELAVRHLAEALADQAPLPHLVAFSTDLVHDGQRPYRSESAPPAPLHVYGRTKRAGEQAVEAYPGPGTVLRVALMYGTLAGGPPPGARPGATGWMEDALRRGEPVTLFTDEFRTPVHVADVLAAVVRVLSLDDPAARIEGTLNCGGSERLSRYAMGEALCDIRGLPRTLLRPALRASAASAAPRVADVSLDTSRLTRALGRAPLAFREGLRAGPDGAPTAG